MATKKITITFETDGAIDVDGAVDAKTAVHEALCRAIHEGDETMWAWLSSHVMDVSI